MRLTVVLLAGLLGMSASVICLLNAPARQAATPAQEAGTHRMLGWEHGPR